MFKHLKRVGTRACRYKIDITVKSVTIDLKAAFNLRVVWKRGPKRAETKALSTLDQTTGEAKFGETLSMLATIYKDEKKNRYLEKKAQISVQVVTSKQTKTVGLVNFNLADYAGVDSENAIKKIFKLEKCVDKNGVIEMAIKVTFLKEMDPNDDTASAITAISRVSMGSEDEVVQSEQDLKGFEDVDVGNPQNKGTNNHHHNPSSNSESDGRVRATPIALANTANPIASSLLAQESKQKNEQYEKQLKEKEEEINKLKARVTEVERTADAAKKDSYEVSKEYKEHLKTTIQEKEKLNSYITELQRDKDKLTGDKEKLERRVEDVQTSYSKIMEGNEDSAKDLEWKAKQIEDLELENKRYSDENLQLSTDLSSLKTKHQKILADSSSTLEAKEVLQRELDDLKESHEKAQKLADDLRDQLEESRKQMESTASAGDAAFIEYKRQTELMVADLKKQIEEEETAKEEALSKQTDLALTMQTLKTDKESSDNDLRTKIDDLNTEIVTMKSKADKSNWEIEKLTGENQHLKDEASKTEGRLNGQIESLKMEVSIQESKNEKLEESNEDLKKRLREAESNNEEALESASLAATSTQKQLDREILILKEDLKQRDERVVELEGDLEKKKLEMAEIRAKILEKQAEENDNSKENEVLIDEIKKLESSLQEKDREIGNLHEKNEGLKTDLTRASTVAAVNTNSEKEVAKLSVENDYLKQQVEELELKLRTFEETSAASSMDDSLKHTIQKLKVELGELREDNTDMQKKLQSTEEELIQVKMDFASAETERQTNDHKLKEQRELNKKYSKELNAMEVDLVGTKQRLGEALNMANEAEMQTLELINEMEALKKKKGKK
eukprot:CAMPEP_0114995490 /NCGR_PEP_ID=MMETSP0216-20121206/13760_1 /TAXON_ID=223996 /ORGANISM="Protocruzia adherens, Strain Boccale" /LENGTH=846 /DNA_ID=CAMNT_0002359541 /DNA_START=40 /DNA_END=2580 /DNA_ORIENTATION=+